MSRTRADPPGAYGHELKKGPVEFEQESVESDLSDGPGGAQCGG